jgi:hypothetical protein
LGLRQEPRQAIALDPGLRLDGQGRFKGRDRQGLGEAAPLHESEEMPG